MPRAALYIIQPGDTITRIAMRFNVPVGALLQVNPQITDPNVIYPGQIINIPLPYGTVTPSPTTAPVYPPVFPY